jgi:hypothetical protein
MGQIVTFYSYKGGTGRSMALANVAWALASNRQKVLVIDWDLEAPGLHRYFRPFLMDKELTEPESKGLIEFVRNYAVLAATPPAEGTRLGKWYEPHAQIWKWATPLRWPRGPILNLDNRGEIQFLPAGRQGPDYAERINTFDWSALYQDHGGDRFFQSVREQAKREFDYVLIDSRTGVSDTSGICTIQMPDILVACYTYNIQSIMGASDIARRVLNKRPGLAVFPVAMRVEFTETDSLIPMRKLARERFGDLVTAVNREEYFDKTEVPYYPKYSFFERLAAFEEFPNAKGSINPDVRHLAFLITGSEMVQVPIEESRRRDVAQEFDPTPAKAMPAASPAQVQSIPPRMQWATIVWAVQFLLLIAFLVIAWNRLPRPQSISVTVDPPTATLSGSDQLQLVSTVHGSSDTGVIWTATLGKISPSGLYLAPAAPAPTYRGGVDPSGLSRAPAADADQTDTITATSLADRSQSGAALIKITKQSRFLVNPVSATLKPGEGRDFNGAFSSDSPVVVSWQVAPKKGTLVLHGATRVSYVAPKDLSERQHVTLTALSPRGDLLASAGIELSPETSPLDRWAYLILAAAAGALGGYLSAMRGLVIYFGNRAFSTNWRAYFVTRPLFGAAAGLMAYVGVGAIFVSGQPQFKNAGNVVAIAGAAGLFTDSMLAKLQENIVTVMGTADRREKLK